MKDKKSCTEICLIAPSDVLGNKARAIIKKRGENIDVYEAKLEEAENTIRDLSLRGGKVFISRQGTKKIIEKQSHVNVVGIPSVLSDYIAIMKRKECREGLVAFFSFDDITSDVKTMCDLLQIHYKRYPFWDNKSGEESVKNAVSDHAVLGIGGVVTEVPAQKYNLPYAVLESSTESIIHAIEMAKQILKVQKEEAVKQEELMTLLERYQTIVDFTRDGIIAVDSRKRINVINPMAEKILGISAKAMIGLEVKTALNNPRWQQILGEGQRKMDQLLRIGKSSIVVNAIPLQADGRDKGTVAIFQDVVALQKSERNVRMGMSEKKLVAKYHFEDIIGTSETILKAVDNAKCFAKANATVLIHGETGTGKELFAQSIHNASNRSEEPFVVINCASLDKNLLESELFGYEEGTFTGALKGGKAGLFELAHRGTLFLDEIGELPVNVQAQLLRVLQEKEIRRLGSATVTPVDVRVIAATNRNLEEEIREGRFRYDLYYRLNILNLYVPPLRERESDIVQIAEHTYNTVNQKYGFHLEKDKLAAMIEYMQGYLWPGNVRELHNFIECISVMSENDGATERIKEYMEQILTSNGRGQEKETDKVAESFIKPGQSETTDLGAWEKKIIEEALKKNYLNMQKTASELNISRSTLWRKMKAYNIHL